MKIFKTLLGAAAAMLLSFTIASPAFAVITDVAEPLFNSAGDSWTCYKRTGGLTYPENGKFYYCGNPKVIDGGNFEGNYDSHRTGYITRIGSINNTAPFTITAMNTQNVKIYVFCTLREWEIYENTNFVTTNRRGVASFYRPSTKKLVVLQYLTSPGQDCDTPTGLLPTQKRNIWQTNGYNLMSHEVGHFVDDSYNVPAGQAKHSVNDNTKLFQKYFDKDLDYINSTTRPNKFVRCVNIFDNTARDTFDYSVPQPPPADPLIVTEPACVAGALNPNMPAPKTTNFEVMSRLSEMGYYLNTTTESIGVPPVATVTRRELFSELFPWAVNTSGYSSSRVQWYIGGTYFMCSKLYVEKVAKTGAPPVAADVAGTRCQLP